MAEHPEFTQEMKNAGAVYLGLGREGRVRRGQPRFQGWTLNFSKHAEWVGESDWFGDSLTLHYAIHPHDPNFEAVCREFGVEFRPGETAYHDFLTDLTACGPAPDEPPEEFYLTLPTDSAERKNYPLYRGLMRYFPAALAGVAKHSKEGNDKHNPGEPMHHARGKSNDHADCILRHLMDLADLEVKEEYCGRLVLTEANALVWRALALSQMLHEEWGGAPMAPGAEE